MRMRKFSASFSTCNHCPVSVTPGYPAQSCRIPGASPNPPGKAFPNRRSCATNSKVKKEGSADNPRTTVVAARIIALLLTPVATLSAESFKLLAIGDSLTTEYAIELPFSAPASDPTNPNTRNWVELFRDRRPSDISLAGRNYAIPGSTADYWDDVLTDTSWNPATILLRVSLNEDLDDVDAALIFLGGNDLKSDYSGIYGDASAPAFLAKLPGHIAAVHGFLRSRAPTNLPIIITTLPDIGATPEIALSPSYQDPILAARARQRIAAVNAEVLAWAQTQPNTYIARIDRVTDRLFDETPFHLNGTEFVYPPDPENPPLHLFCRDGFHPSTVGQALIANEILLAINTFAKTPIPLFTNREILGNILGQDPDQPLLDYLAGAEDDNDSLPPLLEFLLGKDPSAADVPFEFEADGTASYLPSQEALRFADLTILQSATLTTDWTPVPAQNIQTLANGRVKIIPTAPKLFYKFQAIAKP
jgi:lysophospholipase L1-like esterase